MSIISLGNASSYALLAYSTITSTGNSLIYGNMGVYPGTAYTGFPPAIVSGDINAGTPVASLAREDASLAYADAKSRHHNVTMSNVDLGGLTLTPNTYFWSAAAAMSSGDLYLDAQGNEDAVWIFQIESSLTIAGGSNIYFTSGLGKQDNVFWQVGSSATINSGCEFIGDIIAYSSITVNTGASIDGHLIALNGAVTLDTNTVSVTGVPTSNSKNSKTISTASVGIISGASVLGVMGIVGTGYWLKSRSNVPSSDCPQTIEIGGSFGEV